jgi:hypothetical protein
MIEWVRWYCLSLLLLLDVIFASALDGHVTPLLPATLFGVRRARIAGGRGCSLQLSVAFVRTAEMWSNSRSQLREFSRASPR